ncbi:MAG: SDR family oxidoreductase [Campylobacteraceae bacterium]|nr:SDR family oxidoreductase [Campylobacteraceae bacterium]
MKIALITGSSRGLGKSMALNLAKKGYNIIITYKTSKEKAQDVADKIKSYGQDAIVFQLDTENSKSFEKFSQNLRLCLKSTWQAEGIDVLVNNAGIGINSSISDTSIEEFDKLYNIHVKGVFFLTQKLLPMLNNGTSIINISSGLTRFALPGFSAYAMMKGAIEIMTKYLALELGNRDITVNTIAPGAIETDFAGGFVRDNKEVNTYMASQTALGRVGKVDDIGASIATLVSNECHWINAQRIEISGGMKL